MDASAATILRPGGRFLEMGKTDVRDPEGNRLRFGFFEFLPAGLLSFALICDSS